MRGSQKHAAHVEEYDHLVTGAERCIGLAERHAGAPCLVAGDVVEDGLAGVRGDRCQGGGGEEQEEQNGLSKDFHR